MAKNLLILTVWCCLLSACIIVSCAKVNLDEISTAVCKLVDLEKDDSTICDLCCQANGKVFKPSVLWKRCSCSRDNDEPTEAAIRSAKKQWKQMASVMRDQFEARNV